MYNDVVGTRIDLPIPCTAVIPLRGIRRRRYQPLTHPANRGTQTFVHRISLARLFRVASHKASMLHAREVPVLKGIILLLQHLERLRLQIRRVHRIELRREYLYRHLWRDGVDISLCKQRRMPDGEAVQQRLRAVGRVEIL